MLCSFSDYEDWADELFGNADSFHKKFGVYPNIMLASTATWDYIDLFVNLCEPERILPPDGDFAAEPGDDGIKSITCFATPDFEINFCRDERIAADSYMLVFDEAPTFGGEPVDGEGEVYTLIA